MATIKQMEILIIVTLLSFFCNISYATDEVDAILFRTHFVDEMVVKKLREISACRKASSSSSSSVSVGKELPPVDYELNVLYDSDTAPKFSSLLSEAGFDIIENDVQLTGISLKDFISYPSIKPLPISKSHYQHLAYTTWWFKNSKRKNWRFIWCLEHDVAVTAGYWRDVFDVHLKAPHHERDFVSWRIGWSLRADKIHGGNQWNIGLRYGKMGRGNIPDTEVAFHFGPLVRFSSKFLNYMNDQSKLGNVAHSEIAPTTLCNITEWCKYGNLSVGVMGGRDGGLYDYQLPRDISSDIFKALEELRPGKIFHPVRDVGTASDSTNIKHLGSGTGSHKAPKMSDEHSLYYAMCLLRNPRPPRPSYNCPFGCPHHEQITCPKVNCMAREEGTYLHMALNQCFNLCTRTKKCPWTTSTVENNALSHQGLNFTPILEGNFSSVAGPV